MKIRPGIMYPTSTRSTATRRDKMAKLIYWVAPCQYDDRCYSLVGKTKKDVAERVAREWNPKGYGPIEKREIYYKDAFDLFEQLTGEGGDRLWGTLA